MNHIVNQCQTIVLKTTIQLAGASAAELRQQNQDSGNNQCQTIVLKTTIQLAGASAAELRQQNQDSGNNQCQTIVLKTTIQLAGAFAAELRQQNQDSDLPPCSDAPVSCPQCDYAVRILIDQCNAARTICPIQYQQLLYWFIYTLEIVNPFSPDFSYDYFQTPSAVPVLEIQCKSGEDSSVVSSRVPIYGTVSYGDGETVDQVDMYDDLTSPPWKYIVRREDPPIGQLNLTFTIEVLDRINLQLPEQTIVHRETMDIVAIVPLQNISVTIYQDLSNGRITEEPFYANYPVTIDVVSVGSMDQWVVTLDDNPLNTTSQPPIQFLATVGSHTLWLSASDVLTTLTEEVTIEISSGIKPLIMVNNGPDGVGYDIAFLVFVFAKDLGTEYVLDFGDGTPDEEISLPMDSFNINEYLAPEELESFDQTIYEKALVTHAYSESGQYTAEITATGSTVSINTTVVVVSYDCLEPLVLLSVDGQSHTRQQTFTITSDISTVCEHKKMVTLQWKIYNCEEMTENNDFDDILDTSSTDVTIPAYTLHSGCYIFELTVGIVNIKDVMFNNSDQIQISILNSLLVPEIVGGEHRYTGWNVVLEFDASRSIDPDYPETHDGLTYKWFCRLPNQTFSLDMDPEQVLVSGGCFNNSKLYLNNVDNNQTWTLEAQSLQINQTYVFGLVVSKADRDDEYIEQQITVLAEDPPNIQLRCIKNCLDLLDIDEKLVLNIKCVECAQGTRYKWSLKHTPTNTLQDIDWNTQTQGRYGRYLIIEKGTFTSSVSEEYTLQAQVVTIDGVYLYYNYRVTTNLPPTNGSCYINPVIGTVLLTKFNITCNGFEDLDVPLTYEYRVRPSDEEESLDALSLVNEEDSELDMLLQSGDLESATQLIGVVTSILNKDAINEQLKHIQARVHIIKSLQEYEVIDVESIHRKARALLQVIDVQTELSFDTLKYAGSSMKSMSEFLKTESRLLGSTKNGIINEAASLLLYCADNVVKRLSNKSDYESLNKQNVSSCTVDTVDSISDVLLNRRVAGEGSSILTYPTFSLVLGKWEKGNIGESVFQDDDNAWFRLPNSSVLFNTSNDEDLTVVVGMQHFYDNPFSWKSSPITSSVVSLQLVEEDTTPLVVQNLSQPIQMSIPDTNDIQVIHAVVLKDTATLFTINITSSESSLLLEVNTSYKLQNPTYQLHMHYDGSVDGDDADNVLMLQLNSTAIIQPWQHSGPGLYTVALYFNPEDDKFNISISIGETSCFYWNTINENWMSEGCQVSPYSSISNLECDCNHLTFFGSSQLPISYRLYDDSKHVQKLNNPVIICTVVSLTVVYIVCAVLAHWRDRLSRTDEVRLLEDNDPFNEYCYNITICTGVRPGAGTTSNIAVILYGTLDSSDTHVLNPGPILQRGSVDTFQLTTHHTLGDIRSVRLWTDNSGNSASWFVSYVIIDDIQTSHHWNFICNSWLSIDSRVDTVFTVTPHVAGNNLISTIVSFLSNGYPWCFYFTNAPDCCLSRFQQLSCFVSFVLFTSLVNSTLYLTSDSASAKDIFGFLTVTQLITGLECALISLPINLAILLIFKMSFRDSRLYHCEPEEFYSMDHVSIGLTLSHDMAPLMKSLLDVRYNLKKILKRYELETNHDKYSGSHESFLTAHSGSSIWRAYDAQIDARNSDVENYGQSKVSLQDIEFEPTMQLTRRHYTTGYNLPEWCIYIGWCSVIATTIVPIFFIIFYGLKLTVQLSLDLLTSFVLTFLETVFIVQPVILILAAVLAVIFCKQPILNYYMHRRNRKHHLYTSTVQMECLEKKLAKINNLREKPCYHPPLHTSITDCQRKNNFYNTLREVVSYIIFIALVFIIAFSKNVSQTFTMNEALKHRFVGDFQKITTYSDMFSWMNATLIPKLYHDTHDMDSECRLLSSVRLRLIRGESDQCATKSGCNVKLSEDGLYTPSSGWQYEPSNQAQGSYLIGQFDLYPRGGHIIDLGSTFDESSAMFNDIYNSGSLNVNNEAYFIEFVMYNEHVNLISILTFLMESPLTGNVAPSYEIYTFQFQKLWHALDYVVCLYLLYVIYMMYVEMHRLNCLGRRYFLSVWNYVNLLIIIMLWIALVFYVQLVLDFQTTVSKYKSHRDIFTSFYTVAMCDKVYSVLSYFIVLLGTLKLVHLIFKVGNINNLLYLSISGATTSIFWFTATIILVVLIYAQFCYLVFGHSVSDFGSGSDAFLSLLSLLIREYHMKELLAYSVILGRMVFATFTFTIYFMLVPVFSVIMMNSYANQKHQ
ncbi:polycystin-1-like protein 2 [Saccoglossus kowalevskii]